VSTTPLFTQHRSDPGDYGTEVLETKLAAIEERLITAEQQRGARPFLIAKAPDDGSD
jgi:hypothetical protein